VTGIVKLGLRAVEVGTVVEFVLEIEVLNVLSGVVLVDVGVMLVFVNEILLDVSEADAAGVGVVVMSVFMDVLHRGIKDNVAVVGVVNI